MDKLPLPPFLSNAIQRLALGAIDSADKGSKSPANPLSYPKASESYSSELFKNPTAEYRGMPFWAWNNKLNKDQLLRQIDIFAEMGMGGFHMHSRTGLDTEYLGTEFMDMIKACVEQAEKKGLLACLYDEDRWPSGTAGGKVIKDNPAFKKMLMKFKPNFYDGNLLAAYIIDQDENGCLKSYQMLKEVEIDAIRFSGVHPAGVNIWFAYTETEGPDDWYNGQTYVDTLSKDAMAHFIELTHEKYKATIGDKFGTTVPAIFTDEPEFHRMNQLDSPHAGNDVTFAWTADFLVTYEKKYSSSLLDYLPELVWNLPDGKPSVSRVRYRDFSCERFVEAFLDQLADWCGNNNLYLNGHMMEEPTLRQQTLAIGEAMRCYRKMQMPGMDLLCDWTEYNTAKQVSSVGRQNGLRGAMSELYGVTHWDFTFEGHKGCGDWQAALGITQRVHHLSWVSMNGESKRDYPASIGYQSPWYKEYGYVESHFARVGVAMTRGKALTRVGVVHPIESYWLGLGPNGSGDELDTRDRAFGDLTNWLLHGLIDFDFISESLLPDQYNRKAPKGKLSVGACAYDVVVIPNLKTIRSTTLKILQDFTRAGGKVIIAGAAPSFIDADIPKEHIKIDNSKSVLWSQQSILTSLEEFREVQFATDAGAPNADFLYQMRQDGDERFVFICNRDRSRTIPGTLRFRGQWSVQLLDTLSGEESRLKAHVGKTWTTLPYTFTGCASILVRLSPSSAKATDLVLSPLLPDYELSASTLKLHEVTLSEDNVYVLDYAEYKLDDEDWSPKEEILKIDNIIRRRFGMFQKGGNIKQPWVFSDEDRKPVARATLRFTFKSDFTIPSSCRLALEDADKIIVHVNDVAIPSSSTNDYKSDDWWVDQDIRTVKIPAYLIHQGTNTVNLSFDYNVLTNLERIYLLGNFAVALSGVIQPTSNLTWGDIVPQGLPFYAGNVTYRCSFKVPSTAMTTSPGKKSKLTLSIPHFSSPCIRITDVKTHKKLGIIAFQPHTLDLPNLEAGTHELEITAFGNRYNSFGHFHAPLWLGGCGPGMWRTGGDQWTDDYAVKPVGILEVPEVVVYETSVNDDKKQKEKDEKSESECECGWVDVKREEP